jgi:hypothetical protein
MAPGVRVDEMDVVDNVDIVDEVDLNYGRNFTAA